MKRISLILIASLFLLNCYSQKVLLSNSIKHLFSNPTISDVFIVTVTGKTILSGKVRFEIITADKHIIHSETFDAELWCEYIEDFTTKQKEDVIRKKIKEFFLPSCFRSPAIAQNEKYDEDYYDKSSYNDLKADKSSIGFGYQNAMEGMTAIAWSKKKNKVVNYYGID